jgi:hypothetical protein
MFLRSLLTESLLTFMPCIYIEDRHSMDDVRESSLFLSTLQYLSIECCGGATGFIVFRCPADMASIELTELSSILLIVHH